MILTISVISDDNTRNELTTLGFENIDEILKDEHACMDIMTKWNDIALPKVNLEDLRIKLLDAAPFEVVNHKA